MKVKFITHGACLTPMTTNKIDIWTEMFGIPHGQNGAFLADDTKELHSEKWLILQDDVRKRNFFHDWLNWRSDTFGHNAVKDWDLFGPFHPFCSVVANSTRACPCSDGACPVVPNSAQKCDTTGIIDECSNNGQVVKPSSRRKWGFFFSFFKLEKRTMMSMVVSSIVLSMDGWNIQRVCFGWPLLRHQQTWTHQLIL